MKCQKCQVDVFLPFKCPYCGEYFCSEHRLPENHNCPRMELARTPRMDTQPVVIQKQAPYEYTISYGNAQPASGRIRFSIREIEHLAVATLLVVSVGLSIAYLGIFDVYSSDYFSVTAFVAILTLSFFVHEIAHKVVAQKHGLWAEFRLTLLGAVLTLLSALPIQFFKIISPGAVMVSGFADVENMGKISIAGPATNITFAVSFLAASAIPYPIVPFQYTGIFLIAAFFNAWIAVFNLIPFGILDGYKIFTWNKGIWALSSIISVILTILSYLLIG